MIQPNHEYDNLAMAVLNDPDAQEASSIFQRQFPNVPVPIVSAVMCVLCTDQDEVDLRLEAGIQLLSMLDTILTDDDASMGVTASIAKIVRHIENGDLTNNMYHDEAKQILDSEDRCATCGNKDRINDVGLCPECQDCDGCRKGTCND